MYDYSIYRPLSCDDDNKKSVGPPITIDVLNPDSAMDIDNDQKVPIRVRMTGIPADNNYKIMFGFYDPETESSYWIGPPLYYYPKESDNGQIVELTVNDIPPNYFGFEFENLFGDQYYVVIRLIANSTFYDFYSDGYYY